LKGRGPDGNGIGLGWTGLNWIELDWTGSKDEQARIDEWEKN